MSTLLTHSASLQASSDNFGSIQRRDFSRQVAYSEIREIMETIPETDLDREFDFTEFLNNVAVFFFISVKNNAVVLKINSPVADAVVIPAGGMVLYSATGISKVYISGQPASSANIYIQAAGA